jgi:hypothetical protein
VRGSRNRLARLAPSVNRRLGRPTCRSSGRSVPSRRLCSQAARRFGPPLIVDVISHTSMPCPSCSRDSLPKYYWLATWPFTTCCKSCGIRVRCHLGMAHNLLSQVTLSTLMLFVMLGLMERGHPLWFSALLGILVSLPPALLIIKKGSRPELLK